MTQVTVTCGATNDGGFAPWNLNPGDEVVIFEPSTRTRARRDPMRRQTVFVPAGRGPLDLDRLATAFSARTRAVIVCTPNTRPAASCRAPS